MLLLGVFQIASGMHLFDKNFESGRDHFFWYWTYISLFCLAMLALKMWLVMQNRRARGEGAIWREDHAATSIGIEPRNGSDPSGMNSDDDCVVLEIPSRSGDATLVRATRRAQSCSPSNSISENMGDDDDNLTVEIT